MAIAAIFLYMLLVVVICATVVFAGARNTVLNGFSTVVEFFSSRWQAFFSGTRSRLNQGASATNTTFQRFGDFIRAHKILASIACVVIILPVILVFIFRDDIFVGNIADAPRQDDAVIASLLAGERLVPPPPVPPEAFTTAEVVAVRPSLVSASRDWSLLNPNFEQRLLHVFQRMHEQGYDLVLLEGYRSPERQDALAAQGSNVTNARAFQSYHQFGLAADCAFMREGKVVISERDPWAMRGYELYGQEAEAVGLVWGGRWKMMDLGHVELHIPHAIPGKS